MKFEESLFQKSQIKKFLFSEGGMYMVSRLRNFSLIQPSSLRLTVSEIPCDAFLYWTYNRSNCKKGSDNKCEIIYFYLRQFQLMQKLLQFQYYRNRIFLRMKTIERLLSLKHLISTVAIPFFTFSISGSRNTLHQQHQYIASFFNALVDGDSTRKNAAFFIKCDMVVSLT